MNDPLSAGVTALDPDCFEYHPSFIAAVDADALLARLWNELEWRSQRIRLFGRSVLQPRLVAWYGDPDARYRYSGLSLEPLPWHPELASLRQRLEAFCGKPFNSVLANAYRDGNDSMGWHSDNERELGPRPLIASLSLGAPRRLLVRPAAAGADELRRSTPVVLAHGSLLLMKEASQERYQHALPKTRRATALRVNLTYRWVSG